MEFALWPSLCRRSFRKRFTPDGHAEIQALLDASDSNTATVGMGYAQAIVQSYSSEVQLDWQQRQGFAASAPAVTFQPRTWFNEDLESMANLVPGVMALVMAVVGALLTSLTIAREWERGTMEQLISTPVGKLEIQIGKLIPYFILGMIDTAVCAVMSVWWFHVPFRGSWIVLFGSSAMFLLVVLSLGYYISVTAKVQVGANQMAMLATFLPTFCSQASFSRSIRCRLPCNGSRGSCRGVTTSRSCETYFSRAPRSLCSRQTSHHWRS